MIRQLIREYDGDCYIVELPDCDEIRCECEKIVPKEDACECEICNHRYCRGCGVRDYKQTGWFVCTNCLLKPELIIDALIEQFSRMEDQIKYLKEKHERI
jgi:hypothetical protein